MDIDELLSKVADETLRSGLTAAIEVLKAKPGDSPELLQLRGDAKRLAAQVKTLEQQAKQTAEERDAIRKAHDQALISAELGAASGQAISADDIRAHLGAGMSVESGKVCYVGADGVKVDAKTAVAALLKAHPHLAKPAAPGEGGAGSGVKQGDIGGTPTPKKMSRNDFLQLSPEKQSAFLADREAVITQ
jgi:hypothetical protein